MNAYRQHGFNLLELLVTVMVIGVVLGFGVPSFMEFQRSNAMASIANDFLSDVYLARTEAVKRQVAVTLCTSANATAANPTCGVGQGFVVFVDDLNPTAVAPTDGNATIDGAELVLAQHAAPTGTIAFATDNNSTYLAYGPNGFVVPTAPGQAQPSLTTVLFCDDRGNSDAGGRSAARVVTISPTGRGQILRTQADVVTAVAATGGVCP